MRCLFVLVVCLASPLVAAEEITPPDFLKEFVLQGHFVIAVEKGHLNRDDYEDYIMVLQKEGAESTEANRPLLILIQKEDGSLHLAKRNDKVVYCEGCGGMMGDPFQQVEIENGGFTVAHYGGSAWRWSSEYTFAYSRIDDTWQLVKVVKTSFHASSDEVQETVEKPPRDFGKIDIADFDPENYRDQGPK